MTTDYKEEIKAYRLRELKAKAELAELHAAQAARQEAHFLATDDMVRKHYFIGGVDSKNVADCAQHLEFWHRIDPTCDMTIEIHSGGGSALAGINLFEHLTRYSLQGGGTHKLTMHVCGLAASMATVLVQAADERVIGPESWFMVHELSGQTAGKIGELEDTMSFYRRLNDRIGEIYVARSGGKLSPEGFKALWTRQDVWLTPVQALDFGMVDRIGGV
ncbi:ClpP-like protease [Mycobacterium phage Whirlwind]|uniref:ClpP-like protease n=1 Tax=Mycobacterium phage Whirlwind TaxID=1340826 RepID=S5XYD9_9CAUD|nr:head maturation protease [Mycobacterium phage Whirlwind]AGT12694.1 ClpP-like protease [Mycobacterium phage Whirlwind]